MVKRHRFPLSSCIRTLRLITWSMASPQLFWPEIPCHVFGNSSQQGIRREASKSLSTGHLPVASVLLPQGCERGTGNTRDNGARDVAFGWTPNGLAAESGAKERRASWTEVGAVARAIGRSFLLAMSSDRGGTFVACHWRIVPRARGSDGRHLYQVERQQSYVRTF